MNQILAAAAIEELPREECLRLLGDHKVGRVAVAVQGEAPLIVPVNYLLDGEAVVFRSGPGSKLRALGGARVSFQLDEIDERYRTGWSVLVRGRGYEMTRWETDHLALEAWAPGDRNHWIRIMAEGISGRRIQRPEQFVDLGGYL